MVIFGTIVQMKKVLGAAKNFRPDADPFTEGGGSGTAKI